MRDDFGGANDLISSMSAGFYQNARRPSVPEADRMRSEESSSSIGQGSARKRVLRVNATLIVSNVNVVHAYVCIVVVHVVHGAYSVLIGFKWNHVRSLGQCILSWYE